MMSTFLSRPRKGGFQPTRLVLHGFDAGDTVIIRLFNRWVRLPKDDFTRLYETSIGGLAN